MAGIPKARYKVEVNWWKKIGVPDTAPLWTAQSWASQVAGNGLPAGSYVDVSSFIDIGRNPITISRGKTALLGDIPEGRIGLTLTDPLKVFNPGNASSPLNNPTKYVLPLCGIKVSAVFNSVYYPLALGWTTRLRAVFEGATMRRNPVEVEASDLFWRLSEAGSPVSLPLGTLNTGMAIGAILDKFVGGWPYRDLDAGIPFPTDLSIYLSGGAGSSTSGSGVTIPGWPEKDYSSSLLAAIQNVMATSLGMFFIAADGTATFRHRGTANHGGIVQATVTDVLTKFTPEVNADGVINVATAIRTVPSNSNYVPIPQQSLKQTSIDRYGRKEWKLSSPYWKTDGDASQTAFYVVQHFGDPFTKVRTVNLEGRDDVTLAAMLKVDVGDKVTIVESVGPSSADYLVLGLQHTIGGEPFKHQTQWTVVPAGAGQSNF